MEDLFNGSESESDYEFESDDDVQEEREREQEREAFINVSMELTKRPLSNLVSKLPTTDFTKAVNEAVTNVGASNKVTIDVTDDKLYEDGKIGNEVYMIGMDAVECDYTLDTSIVHEPVMDAVYGILNKVIQSMFISLDHIGQKMIFEPQTMTMYNHYNDAHRIGLTIDVMTIEDYGLLNKTRQ